VIPTNRVSDAQGGGHAYLAVFQTLFADSFECGNTTHWSSTNP
jgi:hypothetical protein